MNSIINRWNDINIHTVDAAESDHEEFKNKNKQNNLNVYSDDNYNYEELEKIMQDKM